ncbi:MAG: hypothetical protein JXL97_07655 [Bacteroidales bacterium]|nr:hypothetical protein [Bacteroidales bacterium]
MKNTAIFLGVTILLLLLPVLTALGQPPPPPPQDIPIDGGLLFLLFGGIGLAVKSFFSKKKNEN